MPQRVKLIKSRFKGGKFIWKIFWMGILLTVSVWGRGSSSSVCSGGCLPWETHLCPCVAWPCGEEVNSVKHWNSDNADLIGEDNSCDKGSPPGEILTDFITLAIVCKQNSSKSTRLCKWSSQVCLDIFVYSCWTGSKCATQDYQLNEN